MGTWLTPRQDLAEDQLAAVRLDADRHHVIVGPPGSGKTQILLHRARFLLDAHGQAQRYRIFVFTKVLKSYIASGLETLNLPLDRVVNYDRWLYDLYGELIGPKRPWKASGWGKGRPDHEAIRKEVLGKLQDASIDLPLFDFVLVDEAQDLDETVLDILSHVSRHVTACMDDEQQLYDTGVDEATVRARLGQNRTLLGAYRCSPYVASVSAAFISDPDARGRFERRVKTYALTKQMPMVFLARTFDEERERLIATVKSRLSKGERIAVLFPTNKQVHGFAKAFAAAGVEVEVRQDSVADPDAPAMDFASDVPKLMTYQSAKGLTFDSVFLPRLEAGGFWSYDDEQLERLLFVGITRATTWCWFSAVEKKLLPAVAQRLPDLERAGRVTVERPRAPTEAADVAPSEAPGVAAPRGAVAAGSPSPADDLDDLL